MLREIHTAKGYKEAVRVRDYTHRDMNAVRRNTHRGEVYIWSMGVSIGLSCNHRWPTTLNLDFHLYTIFRDL